MVDPITAIGLVASVVQLVQVLGGFTGQLRRSRHHGEQLVRLRGLLDEIGQLRLRIADDSLEVQQVKKLLERCRLLLEQHDPNMNSSIGLTFKWTSDLDNEIRIINDDLTRMYTRLQVYRIDLPPTPSSAASQHVVTPKLPPMQLPEPAISPVISRRGSLHFIDLPTILSLGEYNTRVPLQRLNILERDSWSRILQYESDDQQVIVTHRIPFGTKPTTDDNVRAKTVHFLAQHEITVEDNDGFRIYCLDPTYTFSSATNCKIFIEKVRERDLVHTFLPKDICQGGQILARFKVLRLWRKQEGSSSRPLVTMSFLDRNVGRQVEIDLRLYGRDAARARDKKVIDVWRKDGTSKLSLSFEGSRDAIGFLEAYQEIHPDPTSTPTLPPLSFQV